MKPLYSIALMLCIFDAFGSSISMASEQVVISKHNSQVNLLPQIDWLVAEKNKQLSDIQNLQDWQTSYFPNQISQDKSLWVKSTLCLMILKRNNIF